MIYLSLGSNLGNRKDQLSGARELIGNYVGRVVKQSRLFESPPWGYESKNRYINCCLAVETGLDAFRVMEELLSVEHTLGRPVRGDMHASSPEHKYADRLIDIDLLLYGDLVMDHPGLKVPHPRMGERKFVLLPLAEIAPDVIHPLKKMTVLEMLDRCPDPSKVRPF